MNKYRKLVNLKDGQGSVEARLRRLLDCIGIDPYDVNLASLRKCALDHAVAAGVHKHMTGESMFWFKSPCWAVREVDFIVHVVLPGMLQEKYPRLAMRLRQTSPRWKRVQDFCWSEYKHDHELAA